MANPLTLAARHRNNLKRIPRLHVIDLPPPERCMYWIAEYRRALDVLTAAQRWPSDFGHFAAQAEDDLAYARRAFTRAREAMRSDIRLERAMRAQEQHSNIGEMA